MISLAVLALISCLLALVLTPVCRNAFRHLGLVDRPDGMRKFHALPVPKAGGVPLMAAYLGAFALLLISPFPATRILEAGLPSAWKLLPAVGIVFAIGLADDLLGLKPWQKIAGQVVASLLAFRADVHVSGVAGVLLPEWLGLPLTIICLVGCSNAFNLIDGVDGLATGAGLFTTITILLGALLTNNVPLLLATAPLAGALLGFLRYNFNPASIFLGDSGSLTVGFLLGCYGILWNYKSTTVLGMTAPLIALSLPLLDTGVAITRRFLRRQPIMAPDTSHIHHRLLARGLTPRKVALLLYGACGVAAALSLLSTVAQDQYRGLIILLFCAVAWIGVQHLGYVEFGVASQMLLGGAFREHLNNQITLRLFEQELAAAVTPEDRWWAICATCGKFGFTHAELWLEGNQFHRTFIEANGNPVWTMKITLANGGQLYLSRCIGGAQPPTVLVSFIDALHKHLSIDTRTHSPGAIDLPVSQQATSLIQKSAQAGD